MRNRTRGRLTYANVVATLALFIALGGASYAGLKLPRNSVGPKQIRKNAVNSAKVRNHSLRAADFKAGQLPRGPRGDNGPAGRPGEGGPPGPKGDPGPGFGADSGFSPQLASEITKTVVGGADVPFSGPSNLGANLHHMESTTTFTVGSGGRYRIAWGASHTAGAGAALAIAVNGTVETATNVPVLTGVGNVSGDAVITLSAGDVITVRNNSAVPLTVALAPSAGARLTIQRVS